MNSSDGVFVQVSNSMGMILWLLFAFWGSSICACFVHGLEGGRRSRVIQSRWMERVVFWIGLDEGSTWDLRSYVDWVLTRYSLWWVLKAITSWRGSLKGGGWRVRLMRSRCFGEVYLAMNRKSNDLVVIRKMKVAGENSWLEKEFNLLKKRQPRFIVRCYDVLQKDGYVWVVCLWSVWGVDCYGVLSVWFDSIITG